jgi:SAM-dependent methyltransferase
MSAPSLSDKDLEALSKIEYPASGEEAPAGGPGAVLGEAILNPRYWRLRLRAAPEHSLHHAVFKCPLEHWQRIEEKHQRILEKWILPSDVLLDAGCGYGRLVELLPRVWEGWYVGIDLSPDLIQLAEERYGPQPGRNWRWPNMGPRYTRPGTLTLSRYRFAVGDLRRLATIPDRMFDWAILVSIRPMVRRHLGDKEWEKMETELRRVARRLLFLEYDVDDPGEVVNS